MTTKLAAYVMEYGEVARTLTLHHSTIVETFKLQARLDGIVSGKTVTFGSVSVLKTFRKFFNAEDATLVASLWSVIVASDKAGRALCDMTVETAPAMPAAITTPTPVEAEIIAIINRVEAFAPVSAPVLKASELAASFASV